MHKILTILPFVVASTVTHCGETVVDPDDPKPQWLEHPCGNGDPVPIDCEDEDDYNWEAASTDLCEDIGVTAGDGCDSEGTLCVLTQAYTCDSLGTNLRSSEAFLTCRSEPFDSEQCPQSSRSVKTGIQYVASVEKKQLAEQVLGVKLARYQYADPSKPGKRLGYILEDHPEATFSGDGRVDLYAYVSAMVALAQQQQVEIDLLKTELSALNKQP